MKTLHLQYENAVVAALKLCCKQPLTTLLAVAIWVVCLIPIPETPLNNISFIDKWTHLVMYGTLVAVCMAEYGHRKSRILWTRLFFFGLLLPIIMGGTVELAQAYCTGGTRSGDWFDALANALGALAGTVIGIPLARVLATRNRGAAI